MVLALSSACAARRPPSPHLASASATQSSPLDARLEAKLAERERLHDWRSSIFGTGGENPPNAKRATPKSKRGTRPLDAVATIRAYRFLGDFRDTPSRAPQDSSLPYSTNGSFDPRVALPEVMLDAAEASEVVRTMKSARVAFDDSPSSKRGPHRARMRCGFDPHHVLVLFDAEDRPIGKIFVCFECSEVVASPRSPAFGGDEPGVMTDEEKATFRRIFDAHGLGAWAYGESDESRELAEYEKRIYGTVDEPTALGLERMQKRSARPSGAPQDITPSRASAMETERLCVWLREAMYERNRQTNYAVVGAFECKGGPKYRFAVDESRGCDARNLCDVPMGRIEACLRGSVLSGVETICTSGLPPECEGLMHCLPYLDWRGSQ